MPSASFKYEGTGPSRVNVAVEQANDTLRQYLYHAEFKAREHIRKQAAKFDTLCQPAFTVVVEFKLKVLPGDNNGTDTAPGD